MTKRTRRDWDLDCGLETVASGGLLDPPPIPSPFHPDRLQMINVKHLRILHMVLGEWLGVGNQSEPLEWDRLSSDEQRFALLVWKDLRMTQDKVNFGQRVVNTFKDFLEGVRGVRKLFGDDDDDDNDNGDEKK